MDRVYCDHGTSERGTSERGTSERGTSERGAGERGTSERGISEHGASEHGASNGGDGNGSAEGIGASGRGAGEIGAGAADGAGTPTTAPAPAGCVDPFEVAKATRDVGSLAWALTRAVGRLQAATGRGDAAAEQCEVHNVCDALSAAVGLDTGGVVESADDEAAAHAFLVAGGLNAVADVLDEHEVLLPCTVKSAVLLLLRVVVRTRAAQARINGETQPGQYVRVVRTLVKAARARKWSTGRERAAERAAVAACIRITSCCTAVHQVEELAHWVAAVLVGGGDARARGDAFLVAASLLSKTSAYTCGRNARVFEDAGAFDPLLAVLGAAGQLERSAVAALTLYTAALACDGLDGMRSNWLCDRWLRTGFAGELLSVCAAISGAPGCAEGVLQRRCRQLHDAVAVRVARKATDMLARAEAEVQAGAAETRARMDRAEAQHRQAHFDVYWARAQAKQEGAAATLHASGAGAAVPAAR